MSEDNSDHESDFESAESDEDHVVRRPTSIIKPSDSLLQTSRLVDDVADVVGHVDVTARRSPSSAADVTKEKTPGSADDITESDSSTQKYVSEQPSSSSDQIRVTHDAHHEDDGCRWDVGEDEIDDDILDQVVDSGHADQCRIVQQRIDVGDTSKSDSTDFGQCEETKLVATSLEATHIAGEVETSRTAVVDDNKKSTVVLDKLSDAATDGDKGSLWGWSSWGASVLSTASSSVATFTSQFEQGLNTVLETVESSLGAPSPEELASARAANASGGGVAGTDVVDDQEESSAVINSDERKETDKNLIGSLVSGVSSSFTNVLDNKVISSGLDTLELIGRKTMDVLQDGDPGLKKKRALLKGDKPCLSEVLREAKENAVRSSSMNPDNSTKIQVHFGTIFDDHQGFVHLEALEMLSKQIEQKVQLALLNLSGDELGAVQSELKRIEDDCVLDIDDENDDDVEVVTFDNIEFFAEKLVENFQKFNVPVNLHKLTKVQVDGQTWLKSCHDEQDKRSETSKDPEEIYDRAIIFLAEFTAKTIEILHKTSELILVSESHGDDVHSLAGFVNTCCREISVQATRYSACLNTAADDSENPDSVTPLITNVYLEASNSNTYIQDAFRLIEPIFQLMFLNRTTE